MSLRLNLLDSDRMSKALLTKSKTIWFNKQLHTDRNKSKE